jgi:hypothetical protein
MRGKNIYLLVAVVTVFSLAVPFTMAQERPRETIKHTEPEILKESDRRIEKKPITMSGEWTDPQGGHYYVRQDGNIIVWYGRGNAQGRFWHHIGSGTIQGNVIQATFRDLPRSTWPDNRGSIRGVINSQWNFVDWDRIPDWRR